MSQLTRKAAAVLLAIASLATAQQTAYGQCGGSGYSGPTDCASGYYCSAGGQYYSQCVPGSGGSGGSGSTPASAAAQPTGTSTSGSSSGRVKFAGVNIAGFDFGMATSGTQDQTQVDDVSGLGVSQMSHFVNQDTFNMFRLPTGWQFITNNQEGGNLDSNNFGKYDKLVQGCLNLGAYCIVDIHNYARWNGAVIGQGGPSDDQFVALWTALATHYKGNSKVVFGVMNEPHDLTISTWAATVQKVVTAIRNAGATTQMILLPGTDYTSAGNFISNGSGAALMAVTNPDGTTTNLVFDVHKYLDSDNSGTHTECVTNNIDSAFSPLATWLRQNSRQALLSETGGGNTASCNTYMCQQLAYINQNSDVYLGWTSWAAGGWASTYELTEVPNGNQDTSLVATCMVPEWKGTS